MTTINAESPIYKCEGCHINNSRLRSKYINQQQCIFEQNLTNSINISIQKSTISTISQQTNNQPSLNRLRSTPTGINLALANIQKINKPKTPLHSLQSTWTPSQKLF
jgi:hypothetical protein